MLSEYYKKLYKTTYEKLYDIIFSELQLYFAEGDSVELGDKEACAEDMIKALVGENLLNKEVMDAIQSTEIEPLSLESLQGFHAFNGVELGQIEDPNSISLSISGKEMVNCVRFGLDGKVYEVWEDPSDGYRSYVGGIRISKTPLKNKIPAIRVNCKYITAREDYYGSVEPCEILEFIDIQNGNVFLSVGTDHINDYYPICMFEYHPELLSINQTVEENQ